MHRTLRRNPLSIGVVLALVVTAIVVVAGAPGASAQTAADVEARDQLIANQENLLNTYRCRFDVDTEIVPGGCIDGIPAVVEEPAPSAEPEPVAEPAQQFPRLSRPPGGLRLDPFYQKHLDAFGIPIVSSAAVPDRAHYQARDLLRDVLANRPDLLEALAQTRTRVAIMAEDEVITDIPEFRWLYQLAPGRDWDVITHGGGVGPNTAIPVLVVAVQNLICLESDLASHADVLIHEIGHAVLTMAIEFKLKDDRFRRRVESAYVSALRAGLWNHTYAATNPDEYWAEGTTAWFDLNSPPDPLRKQHQHPSRAHRVRPDAGRAAGGGLRRCLGPFLVPPDPRRPLRHRRGSGAEIRRRAG